jgi:hypothetical protein
MIQSVSATRHAARQSATARFVPLAFFIELERDLNFRVRYQQAHIWRLSHGGTVFSRIIFWTAMPKRASSSAVKRLCVVICAGIVPSSDDVEPSRFLAAGPARSLRSRIASISVDSNQRLFASHSPFTHAHFFLPQPLISGWSPRTPERAVVVLTSVLVSGVWGGSPRGEIRRVVSVGADTETKAIGPSARSQA